MGLRLQPPYADPQPPHTQSPSDNDEEEPDATWPLWALFEATEAHNPEQPTDAHDPEEPTDAQDEFHDDVFQEDLAST